MEDGKSLALPKTEPDQNAINISCINLTSPQNSLLAKGPSFIPSPTDINWHELPKDFTSFVNQLRYKAKQSQSGFSEQSETKNDSLDSLLFFTTTKTTRRTYTFT